MVSSCPLDWHYGLGERSDAVVDLIQDLRETQNRSMNHWALLEDGE